MYLLFAGDKYYPMGGSRDYLGHHRHEIDAIQAGNDYLDQKGCLAWANVFCTETLEVVWMKEIGSDDDAPQEFHRDDGRPNPVGVELPSEELPQGEGSI